MENIAHDALTAYLAGITTKKNEKEIWWINEYERKITIEINKNNKYILRCYYKNDQLRYIWNHKNGLRHGESRSYYENGQPEYTGNFIK